MLQVEQWATAPVQVLLLADAVLWSRSATAALQQQAAGSRCALRSLADAAALRLETISAALRGQQQLAACSRGVGIGSAGTNRRRLEHRNGSEDSDVEHAGGAQPSPVNPLVSSIPCTPGVSNAAGLPEFQPVAEVPAELCAEATQVLSGVQEQGQLRECSTAPKGWSSRHAGTASVISSATSNGCMPQLPDQYKLSPQQRAGLQALVTAAACHRDVALKLVASGADSPASFEWARHLRHYWNLDTEDLQV